MVSFPFDLNPVGDLDIDLRGVEKTMWALTKLLEEQGFETEAEAERFMNTFIGKIPQYTPKTDVEKAQSVAYDAFKAKTHRKRVRLARKALDTSPDCADAYVLLAEETAETPETAAPLYAQGVEAGERALGEMIHDKDWVGDFWGYIDARPYMRARFGLAQALWESGEREVAIGHARELLRLDEDDHQGVRYELVNWAIRTGDDTGARALLKRYPEDTTPWLYSHALLTFREKGNSHLAKKRLLKAIGLNPMVATVFAGGEALEEMLEIIKRGELPDNVALLPEELMLLTIEAVTYAIKGAFAWEETPGAFEWLFTIFEQGPEEDRPKRPMSMKSGKPKRSRKR